MINKVIFTLVLAAISSCLYAIGGGNLLKLPHNKLYRRLGCPLIALIALWLWGGFNIAYWWAYLATYGLSYPAISTYHDYTGSDNFYLHAAGLGIAAFPLLWAGVSWYAILIRAVVLAVAMGVWSYKLSGRKVIPEEMGRGALYILTLPLLAL